MTTKTSATIKTLATNRVHQGDCVEKLGQLQSGTVDLVFADPPFNIGYTYDVYDDEQSAEDYLGFCRKWMGEVHRVLKDDGAFWLAIGDEYAAELKIQAKELGFHCRSWVIWYYTFGVNCVRGFSRSHTHLFYFIKDAERFTFNGDNPTVRVPSARQLVYADARANTKGRLPDNTWILRPQDAPAMGFSPSHDTWYFARVAGTFKEREGFHGCQMPEQLLGRIIRVSSNPGELVLDPFGGSGTTLVVAKKLGRQFMGFELSEDYVQHIEDRLNSCQVGDPLDGPADPIKSAPPTSKGKKRTAFRNGRPVIALNSEISETIEAAFREASNRESGKKSACCHAEEVLLDPERNAVFSQHCKRAKLAGDARTWMEFLLQLSRQDKLKGEGKRPKQSLKAIEAVSDAAEIAFQMMSVDYALSLEALLCTPDAAAEFDQIATQFSDEETAGLDSASQTFRSAIWNLHRIATDGKVTRKAKQLADQFLNVGLPEGQPISAFIAQPTEQPLAGIYAISDEDSVLFVGQSRDVTQHVRQTIRRPGWQRFQPTEIQFWPVEKPQDALVQRSLFVTWLRPWLNAHFLHQPIATQLF
ncbi:DNA-methyltransferase [Roseiconus lacunae]|uniref:DNA-methyltransferase n=1 Tax=Roseiconus lacunae TaxID=2605694 RepID=UPI001F435D71|nr:site-specific DNA-methyltransferase [Roseiconus lacunae]